MIIVDTNIFIEILIGTEFGKSAVARLEKSPRETFGYGVITWFELCARPQQKPSAIELLQGFEPIALTLSIAEQASEIFNLHLAKNRRKIPDALIAATALQNNAPLWTLNTKDFRRIPKLRLF